MRIVVKPTEMRWNNCTQPEIPIGMQTGQPTHALGSFDEEMTRPPIVNKILAVNTNKTSLENGVE